MKETKKIKKIVNRKKWKGRGIGKGKKKMIKNNTKGGGGINNQFEA